MIGSFIRKIVILMLETAPSIASTNGKKLSPGWTINDRFWTLLYASIGVNVLACSKTERITAEVRDQKSEVRSQRSEVSGQRAEVRSVQGYRAFRVTECSE